MLPFREKKTRLSQRDCSRVNEPLEDPTVLREEGSVGSRYTGASGKSLEALLFYGLVVVGAGCRSRPERNGTRIFVVSTELASTSSR